MNIELLRVVGRHPVECLADVGPHVGAVDVGDVQYWRGHETGCNDGIFYFNPPSTLSTHYELTSLAGPVYDRPAVPPAPGDGGPRVARGGAGQLQVLPLPQYHRPRPAHPATPW